MELQIDSIIHYKPQTGFNVASFNAKEINSVLVKIKPLC
jgi:hypothetical protein